MRRDNKNQNNVRWKIYLALLQVKNNKFRARHKSLSSGMLGIGEVDISLEEQSVVESSFCVFNSENKNNGKIIQNNSSNMC